MLSLQILELSLSDFQAHLYTLWSHFQVGYTRTPQDWSLNVSGLALHHKALDLALISLATMRLSLCGEKDTYQIFSLETYSGSLQIFRRLLQKEDQESKSLLVVISLIFTLFEAAQQYPTRIYESGWAGHLKGALFLMQRQGPAAFQIGGFHAAFKKLREMAVCRTRKLVLILLTRLQVLLAYSSRSPLFLAQPEWKEIPWAILEKSPRDRLYDIATEITTLYSTSYEHGISQLLVAHRGYSKLVVWRKEWLSIEFPSLPSSCQVCFGQECSCFEYPHASIFSSNDFTFLMTECTAMLLMVTYMTLEMITSSRMDLLKENKIPDECLRIEVIQYRALKLRRFLKETLTLPCFGQAISDCPGITEGRCRALFPTWVLSQEPKEFSACDSNWWLALSSRVNYGMN